MRKSTSHFVRLGIFVVAGSMLLLIAAYLIGSEQQLFSRTFELSTVFENVAGLQEGNNVRFSGINVGQGDCHGNRYQHPRAYAD